MLLNLLHLYNHIGKIWQKNQERSFTYFYVLHPVKLKCNYLDMVHTKSLQIPIFISADQRPRRPMVHKGICQKIRKFLIRQKFRSRAFLTRGAGGATAPPLLLILGKNCSYMFEFPALAPPLLEQSEVLPPHSQVAEKSPAIH